MVTNTFHSEDAFYLTNLGLVVVGQLAGTVTNGQYLVLPAGTRYRIKAIQHLRKFNSEVVGLVLETTLTSGAEARAQGLVGITAQLAP